MYDERKKITRAPYNFIPLCGKPIERYKDISELPRHDLWYENLLSGELALTLTAKTPLFVSNGKKDKENGPAADFVRGADGSYQIPGSTLRGLLRENMQILGFGCLRRGEDFQDIRPLYRSMAAAKGSLRYKARQHYVTTLNIGNPRAGLPLNRKVSGGYLHRERGKYFICPVKGEVLCVRRTDPIAKTWVECYAFSEPVFYRASGKKVTRLLSKKTARYCDLQEGGWQSGWLLCTGEMKNQNRLYIFPEEDVAAARIPITKQEELSYLADFELRKNTLRNRSRHWALPQEMKCKPVFYLRQGNVTSFGMSQYLRLSYEHSVGEGVPFARDSLFLDYPHAVFGFAEARLAYRSRVSVGACRALNEPQTMKPFQVILGEPKLSFFAAYTQEGRDYNQNDFRLRGYKQYWLKDVQLPPSPEKIRVATWMRPLPKGTRFSGTVRYRNLYPDELGLLLWCLRLEEGCFQSIGMGKPYGFGRVQVTIDSLTEYEPRQLYAADGLTACGFKNTAPAARVDELIRTYRSYVTERGLLPVDPALRSEIRDFFYMKSTVRTDRDAVSYMRLTEYKNLEVPLPTVEELRGARQGKAAGP